MGITVEKIERYKVVGPPTETLLRATALRLSGRASMLKIFPEDFFGDDEYSFSRFFSLFFYSRIFLLIKKSLRIFKLASPRYAVEPGPSDFEQKSFLIKILPKELIGETSCR